MLHGELVEPSRRSPLPGGRGREVLTMSVVIEMKSPIDGIVPPRIIEIRIVVVGTRIIIFPPEVDLLARKERISIIHFTELPKLLSKDLAGNCDFPSSLKEIRIQIFLGDN
jgi:hypothetical protein